MTLFKVMHISDLHCGKDPDVANIKSFYDSCPKIGQISGFFRSLRHGVRQTTYNLEIGKKVARFLVEHSADQSLLIISGDLAASGIEDDLKVALAFIEGTPRSTQMFFVTSDVTPTIAKAALPVLIVPGNHDRFQDNYGMWRALRAEQHCALTLLPYYRSHPRASRLPL